MSVGTEQGTGDALVTVRAGGGNGKRAAKEGKKSGSVPLPAFAQAAAGPIQSSRIVSMCVGGREKSPGGGEKGHRHRRSRTQGILLSYFTCKFCCTLSFIQEGTVLKSRQYERLCEWSLSFLHRWRHYVQHRQSLEEGWGSEEENCAAFPNAGCKTLPSPDLPVPVASSLELHLQAPRYTVSCWKLTLDVTYLYYTYLHKQEN